MLLRYVESEELENSFCFILLLYAEKFCGGRFNFCFFYLLWSFLLVTVRAYYAREASCELRLALTWLECLVAGLAYLLLWLVIALIANQTSTSEINLCLWNVDVTTNATDIFCLLLVLIVLLLALASAVAAIIAITTES